jgi:uncharacterized RDD family membrane protein YckC
LNVREEVRKAPRAALSRRWGATILDLVVVAVGMLGLAALIPQSIREQMPTLPAIAAGCLLFAYYLVGEGLLGLTVGKLAADLRVVDAAGNKPGLLRALVRTLLRFVEVNPVLFGGLPAGLIAYFSPTGQRLGDYLSNTFVVRTSLLTAIPPAKSVAQQSLLGV